MTGARGKLLFPNREASEQTPFLYRQPLPPGLCLDGGGTPTAVCPHQTAQARNTALLRAVLNSLRARPGVGRPGDCPHPRSQGSMPPPGKPPTPAGGGQARLQTSLVCMEPRRGAGGGRGASSQGVTHCSRLQGHTCQAAGTFTSHGCGGYTGPRSFPATAAAASSPSARPQVSSYFT